MASPKGYTRLQIALHWAAALLIVQQFIFHDAISAAWKSRSEGLEIAFDPLVLAHVAGGILVLLAAFWRLSIKARRGAPEPPGQNALQNHLARAAHLGLYAAMILLPVSGLLAWFGNVEAAAEGHEVLKAVLIALVLLHVAGVVYHQFVLKDGLMNRMRKAAD